MPNINSNRRLIGRDILQKYATEEIGGGDMIKTGSFISNGVTKQVQVDFKPKVLFISIKPTTDSFVPQTTYIFTEYGTTQLYDVEIADYTNRLRKTIRQTVNSVPAPFVEFYDTGFVITIDIGAGYYIALG